MKSIRAVTILSVAGILVATIVARTLAGPSGGSSAGWYTGKLQLDTAERDQCSFSVDLEPIQFQLNSVQNKYKLVRIRFENAANQVIALSSDRDTIQANGAEAPVPGFLSLRKGDPTFWDTLGKEIQEAIAYPAGIQAGGGMSRSGFFYAWFPADKLIQLPNSFGLTIDSKPVELKHPAASGS